MIWPPDYTAELFPAHAGMNRKALGNVDAGNAVPRTRGDEPTRLMKQSRHIPCSPHTRG